MAPLTWFGTPGGCATLGEAEKVVTAVMPEKNATTTTNITGDFHTCQQTGKNCLGQTSIASTALLLFIFLGGHELCRKGTATLCTMAPLTTKDPHFCRLTELTIRNRSNPTEMCVYEC